jgi:hypothetical protein
MIEPTPELLELVAVVEIDDVRLVEGSASTTISAAQVSASNLNLKNGARVVRELQGGAFGIQVTFEAQVVPQQPAGAGPAISFRVVHELTYKVPAGSTFATETLEAFARFNGIFNAWPYWREYVQSATSQMGLPRLILPVFRGAGPRAIEATVQRAASVSAEQSVQARPEKKPAGAPKKK